MAENKTKATELSVDAFLDTIADSGRRADCRVLVELAGKALQEKPKMWGSSIVGFGTYHYTYDSGREGDSCVIGLASRKADISLYLPAEFEGRDELLGHLGPHKTGKGCLYLKQLAGINLDVLREIIIRGAQQRKAQHGTRSVK